MGGGSPGEDLEFWGSRELCGRDEGELSPRNVCICGGRRAGEEEALPLSRD